MQRNIQKMKAVQWKRIIVLWDGKRRGPSENCIQVAITIVSKNDSRETTGDAVKVVNESDIVESIVVLPFSISFCCRGNMRECRLLNAF